MEQKNDEYKKSIEWFNSLNTVYRSNILYNAYKNNQSFDEILNEHKKIDNDTCEIKIGSKIGHFSKKSIDIASYIVDNKLDFLIIISNKIKIDVINECNKDIFIIKIMDINIKNTLTIILSFLNVSNKIKVSSNILDKLDLLHININEQYELQGVQRKLQKENEMILHYINKIIETDANSVDEIEEQSNFTSISNNDSSYYKNEKVINDVKTLIKQKKVLNN